MVTHDALLELRRRLEEVVGEGPAETLMTQISSISELATREDIRALRRDWDERFGEVDRRFADVDRRFEQVDRRFEHVDARFDLLEQQIIAAKFDVIGTLRGDLVMQTRTMVFTMAGTVAALGGLAIALSRL